MAYLEADAELAAMAVGGVHRVQAPEGTERPFVTVSVVPGGGIASTLGQARAIRRVWVAVVGHVSGAGSLLAEQIDERIETLLADHVLTLPAPWSASPIRRRADIDEPVIDDGVEIDQLGGMYLIAISGSAS